MRRRNHLIVFARPPRLGRGKRRLAAGIGAVAAWRFYRTVLAGLLRRLDRDPRWVLWLAVTPDRAVNQRGWPNRHKGRMVGQGSGHLGRRMARVMAGRPPGPVVLVGSDIPDIRPNHIAEAFRLLGRHDVLFGPAGDGGYWLVGARRTAALPAGLFEGVRWSTRHTLADTLASLPSGASVGFAAILDDVDDAESYRRWRVLTQV